MKFNLNGQVSNEKKKIQNLVIEGKQKLYCPY
jgi:hypothetical protein